MAGICIAVVLDGCSGSGSGGGGQKPAAPPPEWALNLNVDGTSVKLPLEVMDVFLVEDEQYAECYMIEGPGVALTGKFPLNVHVGYGEDWKELLNHKITIDPKGDYRVRDAESTLTLPGQPAMQVTGGSFTVVKISGESAGTDGDITLSGPITIQVQTEAGEKTLEGTFAVHAVTWG